MSKDKLTITYNSRPIEKITIRCNSGEPDEISVEPMVHTNDDHVIRVTVSGDFAGTVLVNQCNMWAFIHALTAVAESTDKMIEEKGRK